MSKVEAVTPAPIVDLPDLVALAERGLVTMRRPGEQAFAHTLRGRRGVDGPRLERYGRDPLYDAIVTLGVGRLPVARQQIVFGGPDAMQFSRHVADRAATEKDLGAVALAAWADAEVGARRSPALWARLREAFHHNEPLLTVDVAWALSAATAAMSVGPGDAGDVEEVADSARQRLLSTQGPRGLFARAGTGGVARWRAHVGCFADEVYPIQALARLARARNDEEALRGADRCAQRICELQGPDGQWWWHYDARTGSVVESFPVYSVHQHAMAPMALLDLVECGGADHRMAVAAGLRWLSTHPEVFVDLVDPQHEVVWRKVGRREPRKAARAAAALQTSILPGSKVPGVDRLLPPTVIDFECRPYELGWILYAWLSSASRAAA